MSGGVEKWKSSKKVLVGAAILIVGGMVFGAFRLAFAAGNQGFRPVGVQLTGCRSVTGLGPARSWSQSPQFGPLLTRTVGGAGRLIPGRHPSSVPTP